MRKILLAAAIVILLAVDETHIVKDKYRKDTYKTYDSKGNWSGYIKKDRFDDRKFNIYDRSGIRSNVFFEKNKKKER